MDSETLAEHVERLRLERIARTSTVECLHCTSQVPHRWHYYSGCSCAAGGVWEDHSGHCDLYGVSLVQSDALLCKTRPVWTLPGRRSMELLATVKGREILYPNTEETR